MRIRELATVGIFNELLSTQIVNVARLLNETFSQLFKHFAILFSTKSSKSDIENITNIFKYVFCGFFVSFSFAQKRMVALFWHPLYGDFHSCDIKQRPRQPFVPKIALVIVPTHSIINHETVQIPGFQK